MQVHELRAKNVVTASHAGAIVGTVAAGGHSNWWKGISMDRFGRSAIAAALVAAAGTVAIAGPARAAPNDGTTTVFISEIHYDNASTDSGEAIEVFGPAGTDLSGWSLVLYNGANGSTYNTAGLAGLIPDEGAGYGVVDVTYPSNGIQNGAPDGVALVNGTEVVQFLSYEGTFTAVGGPADGLLSVDIGVSQSGSGPVGSSLKLTGSGSCPAALSWSGESPNTFGEVAPIDPSGGCEEPPPPPPPPVVLIHDVQGNGLSSPLAGQTVTIEGVVVADHEGPAPTLRGLFIQEEDTDADADPTTSEGIFVFTNGADTASMGDRVRATGQVVEFGGLTELTNVTEVTVLESGVASPTPATITFPVNAVVDLEAFEGMVATIPQELVISEYFNYDRFGEVVVALPAEGEERPMTPTALFAPDSAEAIARADLNLRSRITIDDGFTNQNPDTVVHPITRDDFTSDNAFRGGDQVSGLTGPLFEAFGLYRILPFAEGGYDTYTQTIAPAEPDPVGGSLQVASMNTLNYFLSIDTADTCGPTQDQDCRGADTVEEFERQRVKLLNALEGIDADVLGLIEVENTPGVEPLADIVAGLNDRLGADTYDYVGAGVNSVVGTDAIKVGIIYRPATVTPLGDPAILDSPEFLDPNMTGADRNRAAVAQSFVEHASGEVFSVVVNHLKSKGSACDEEGEDTLAGNCDVTRTLAAGVLADWLATSPTGVADTDWMIVGDLNSYDHEAPIGVLESAGYTDLAGESGGEYAYSYVFDGQYGYLDYAMSSSSLTPQVTGATEWHINSDEPDIVDYDTSFKSATQAALFDPTTPFRSSDHDAVIVGLQLDGGIDAEARAVPKRLWPVNGLLRPVLVFAKGGWRLVDSEIVSVTSSEPDSGLHRRDRPNDIIVVGDKLVLLRAEEFTPEGRTYTIEVRLAGGGQIRFDDAVVTVGR